MKKNHIISLQILICLGILYVLLGCGASSHVNDSLDTNTDTEDTGENEILSGQGLYENNCFSCHISAPHSSSGALSVAASNQTLEWWEDKFDEMLNKSSSNHLHQLSESKKDTLIDYLFDENNS